MGTWNTAINGNDSFLEIYQNFFDLYNQGQKPVDISKQLQEDFKDMFNDYDDRNNSLFGLALAQWETKSLDPAVFTQVKEIIEKGNDLVVWRELDADEKIIKKRQTVLEKFLIKISTEKEKPKRRVRQKFNFTSSEIIKIIAPDNKKFFEISENYTNGVYEQTGSGITWSTGGGSVFYFTGQGQFVTARWLDNQTLEVTHDKKIIFTKKDETFFYCGDQGIVIYIPSDDQNAL
ncbi:MAG: hypothetical protein ABI378_10425 [Chitinophagaceae bacterium]